MGFTVTIEGPETINLGKEIIKNVQASLTTPPDSRARSTKDLANLSITGNLYTIEGSQNTDTIKLFEWAQIPAEKIEEAYRNVTVQIEIDNQIFRKIQYPNAFVIDYTETYNDTAGYGQFTLILRQKADKTADVKIEGGLPLGSETAAAGSAAAPGEKAPPAAAPKQSLKSPGAATTGGIAGGIAGAAGNIAQAMQNAAKTAVQQAAQKALQKADPSGTAAAAATTLAQAAQNPQALVKQTMQTAMAEQTEAAMQKAKLPNTGNMIKGF